MDQEKVDDFIGNVELLVKSFAAQVARDADDVAQAVVGRLIGSLSVRGEDVVQTPDNSYAIISLEKVFQQEHYPILVCGSIDPSHLQQCIDPFVFGAVLIDLSRSVHL